MRVVLTPSLSPAHKYRVILPNKRSINFGHVGVEDYTDHRDSQRMRTHLVEKGAIVPETLRLETDIHEIHRGMLMIDHSTHEDWDDWYSTEYWERWMLWSYPNIDHAKLWMAMRKGILFMPVAEDLWYNGY
jgi:hypothetical protein